ncbi:HtaA domain-containing protein [Subtercola endophyticus]|uniref:HtaA domain-containing protein n=1 Tax=Subtercola endophyticus TaxID=2895559 RepID=UPI001E5AEEE2|nr:HtaA domain-containing protein [Subtercola endophyticus]UFS58341.1 HtaA domain-containing protein [Subtercola endophyticus]
MTGPTAIRLDWAIKQSFLEYVSGLDDGEISAAEPATVTGLGPFSFTAEADQRLDIATGFGVLRFRGRAVVSGHFGMMSVTITDPWVQIDGDGAALTIPDPDRDPASGKRIEIVRLAVEEPFAPQGFTGIPSTLTVEAIGVFNGQYQSGTEMDPVTIVFATP